MSKKSYADWCNSRLLNRKSKEQKLNLGCGNDIVEGWVNADKNRISRKVIYCDIDTRLPWKDNTFDCVKAFHVLEHAKDREHIINELWRVCKPGSRIFVKVPHASNPRALTDPTHYSAWDSVSFDKFKPGHKRHYISYVKFYIVEKEFSKMLYCKWLKGFSNKHKEFWEIKMGRLFPIQEMEYQLEVMK